MHPALAPLVSVARALGPLVDEIVFIGGAIAPLLQTAPPFPRVRPTKDVDGLAAVGGHREIGALQERLQAQGFTPALTGRHAHQWLAPDGTPFDLVPAGGHPGGSGNPWDTAAVATAECVELEPGFTVRHASASVFLALQWAAYWDRGTSDPLASHDLEDILALVASRPQIITELREAPENVQAWVAEGVGRLLASDSLDDLLAAHLNNATEVLATIEAVHARLATIAELM